MANQCEMENNLVAVSPAGVAITVFGAMMIIFVIASQETPVR